MKNLKTKGLNNKEYQLEYCMEYDNKKIIKKHLPDINVIPFTSFGYGTLLPVNCIIFDTGINMNENVNDLNQKTCAEITSFYNKNGKFIIEAERNTKKEQKKKYIKQIINEIDLRQGLANETFINILTNVFSKKNLKEILNTKNIEMLSFDGLMYLKVNKKAYRL